MLVIVCAVMAAAEGVRHWTETQTETIWRGRYKNCDYGYSVILPDGVVAHGDPSPSPNHGSLVSAKEPGITAQVMWAEARLIYVHSEYGVAESGSAREYLKRSRDENDEVIETRDLQLKGLPAAFGHYESKQGTAKIREGGVGCLPKRCAHHPFRHYLCDRPQNSC